MFFSAAPYLRLPLQKYIALIAVLLLVCIAVTAQNKLVFTDSTGYLKSFLNQSRNTNKLIPNPTVKTRYARPNNQLMSWPDYPLTGYQIEQRNKQLAESRKLKNVIAHDVIKALLTKKTATAVIPKF
jgi:hypothetical protein